MAATTGDNFRDNVEQVVINGGGTGSYFVEVSHKGTLLDGNNQSYSLIISMTPPPPSGSNVLIDENFSGGLPAGWSVETISGINWTINTPVPGDSRLDNGTGGVGNFAMVDNDYSNRTTTSLRMPTFDLSSVDAVVLRFKSYFYFDFLESINVDISTDGGTGWGNVWQWQGFNPLPTLYTLDLTGAAAGQASVTLRFRFDSHGDIQGNLWQVDDVELEVFGAGPPPDSLPGQASNPGPADSATGVPANTDLSCTAGSDATSHDVYFGTNPVPGAGESQGNQTSASGYDSTSLPIAVSDGVTSTLDFALTPTVAGGGTGALKGTVTDSSGTKLGGVLVEVQGGGQSATTNKGGKYTIQNVPEGSRDVIASKTGFSDTPGTVEIIAGSTATLNISMPPN